MHTLFAVVLSAFALAQNPTPVILDTDLGDDIDDTWALAQLLGDWDFDCNLIVTASDDTPTKARLVAKILDRFGRKDIPIGIGKKTSDQPINQSKWLGEYDLKRYTGKVHEDGVKALIDAIHAGPHPMTLIVLGPQTNIAEALKRDPSIAKEARVVCMAGGVRAGYDGKPTPVPEWNVMKDIAAARAVFAAPWDITMAPLDVCGTLTLGGARYASVRNSVSARARTLIENYDQWSNRKNYAPDASSVLFDTVAVGIAREQQFVEMEALKLSIDDKGVTREDANGRPVHCALRWKDRAGYEDALVRDVTGGSGNIAASEEFPAVDALPVQEDLPDPFTRFGGRRVTSPARWPMRRAEILSMFLYYEYGHVPPAPDNMIVEPQGEEPKFDGAAVLERYLLKMGPDHKVQEKIGVYRPVKRDGKRGVVMAVEPVGKNPTEVGAKLAIERGYLFAGYDRHTLDEDNADRSDGVHPIYPDYDWATLAAWAWGASRLVDYLATRDDVDATKLAITGHSRGGKTALLAAVLDERISLVAPHGSGEGGTGSHRIQGKMAESLRAITDPKRFGYWFHPRAATFVGKEKQMPFDQHFLRATVAPRAIVSMDGLDDHWANPLGTQQMWRAAQPVFDFLGVPQNNRLYFRPGGHDMTPEDWAAYIDYCDYFFKGSGKLPGGDGKSPFPDVAPAQKWTAPDAGKKN